MWTKRVSMYRCFDCNLVWDVFFGPMHELTESLYEVDMESMDRCVHECGSDGDLQEISGYWICG